MYLAPDQGNGPADDESEKTRGKQRRSTDDLHLPAGERCGAKKP
jgi:hypothetical protein